MFDPKECRFAEIRPEQGRPVTVALRIPHRVSRARLLSPDLPSGEALHLQQSNEALVVALPAPALRRYAMVVFDP